MNKIVILLYFLIISSIIILGIINKRSIEDIGLCLITAIILIGALTWFKYIMTNKEE